jgi:hypothetical protein
VNHIFRQGGFTAIKSGDELAGFMRKALEIERGFESVAQWEGYVSVKDKEFRDVLFQLVSDSDGHARTVESLLEMVRTEDDYRGFPLHPRVLNFRGKDDVEVMTEISRIENVMFDMYSDIRDALKDSDISGFMVDTGDSVPFTTALNGLIEDEARHMSIISKYVRKLDRLR